MIRWSKTIAYVYFAQEEAPHGPIKIGTAIDPAKRLRDIQGCNPRPITLLFAFPAGHAGASFYEGRSARVTERGWHEQFSHLRIRGEWFHPGQDLLDAIEAVRKLNPSAAYAMRLLSAIDGGASCRG